MPTTRREQFKTHAAKAYAHLDEATDSLAKLGIAFQEAHPELAEGIELSFRLIDQAQQIIAAFYRTAWGVDIPSRTLITQEGPHEVEVTRD